MAPTEILAEQHAHTIRELVAPLGLDIALVTGRMPKSQRTKILDGLRSGKIRLIVGTHALLQNDLAFADLALIVVDEQHRFGVVQRAMLREKGNAPHLLVMTATPIPRSLSLTPVWRSGCHHHRRPAAWSHPCTHGMALCTGPRPRTAISE